MARIVDVAARAGVSTATVSRVLNGTPVRPDLEAAVRRAVAELDYSPNRTARSLRRRHSDVIALVIPDVENPFFTSVARGVEDVAMAAGLSVVLCNTDDDDAKERRYLEVAEQENMAGVIVAPATMRPALDRLVGRGRAVVVIDRTVPDDVDQVVFDNVALGRHATRALLAAGHTAIACITGPRSTSTAVERATGWREELQAAGLAAPDDWLVHATFRVDGGRRAMGELLERAPLPAAVLATNNLVGVGVLQALSATPGAATVVSIIGDVPFRTSDIRDVALLPLRPRAMGEQAARLLLDRLAKPTRSPRTVVQATGPAPASG